MLDKTERLPTLVVIDSFDRSVSSNLVIYEKNEEQINTQLLNMIASLNTYVSREFLFFVRFIAGSESE